MSLLILLLVLVLPTLAWAGDWVCGDATKLERFTPSVDASKVPPCPAPFVLSPLPDDEAIVTAQRTLYASLPPRHLKVIDGLMAEMTQAEKDAVDLPAQQHAAAVAVAHAEIQGNEVCANNTLTEITAYWKGTGGKQEQLQATIVPLDSAIAALAPGPAKTAIAAAREAIVVHMTMFVNDAELQWRYICSRAFVRP